MSAAKAKSYSPKLVRDAISSSVSLVAMLTTLLKDALDFPLDFLFMTVIHYWLSICQDGSILSLLEE